MASVRAQVIFMFSEDQDRFVEKRMPDGTWGASNDYGMTFHPRRANAEPNCPFPIDQSAAIAAAYARLRDEERERSARERERTRERAQTILEIFSESAVFGGLCYG